MSTYHQSGRGFTIVELLIVIVVIAVLAAITIVAFNGIQDRARASAAQSAASQAVKKVMAYAIDNSDQYPADLSAVGVADSGDTTYQYTSNNAVSPREYCVTATTDDISYYILSTGSTPVSGICPGHNLIVWDKADPATAPVPAGIIDTSTFRTSTASLRFNPGMVGNGLLNSPLTGDVGKTVTVRLWLKSDSGWNGTNGNSKIRFGATAAQGGALLTACGYNGVKLTWTQATCSYTLNATYSTVLMSVGNDGTIGNIWIDDLSVSIQ